MPGPRRAKQAVRKKAVQRAVRKKQDNERYGNPKSEAYKRDSAYMKQEGNYSTVAAKGIRKLREKADTLSTWEGVKRLRHGNPDY
jgi:hypothetical protein